MKTLIILAMLVFSSTFAFATFHYTHTASDAQIDTTPIAGQVLLESGDVLLLESGDSLLLEGDA